MKLISCRRSPREESREVGQRSQDLLGSELGFLSTEVRDDGTESEVRGIYDGSYQGQQRGEEGHGQSSQQGVRLASRWFGFLNEMRKVCSRRKLEVKVVEGARRGEPSEMGCRRCQEFVAEDRGCFCIEKCH